jgi:hypothetical protein
MQFAPEIWRRSENIQALGDFSKLIGEKSPIRRQRVKSKKLFFNFAKSHFFILNFNFLGWHFVTKVSLHFEISKGYICTKQFEDFILISFKVSALLVKK